MRAPLTFVALALGLAAGAFAAPPPLDVGPLFDEVDANHDGCISAAEWFGARLPKSAYEMLKDAKGCVTVAAMHATAPPPGIDLDGDGKLTAEEFREFDRRGAATRPPPPAASARWRTRDGNIFVLMANAADGMPRTPYA